MGFKDGFGIYKWADKSMYTGFWCKDSMKGEGEFIWPDSRQYKG